MVYVGSALEVLSQIIHPVKVGIPFHSRAFVNDESLSV